MGFWQKLKSIHFNRASYPPDVKDAAGVEGENAALALVLDLARKRDWYCRSGIRVPKIEARGKHEIDILLFSPECLLAIEVKNWGGQLEELADGSWSQVNSQGQRRIHENALNAVRRKIQAANHYLGRHRLALPREALRVIVVFTNPRLILGPRLERTPGINTLGQLANSIRRVASPDAPGVSGLPDDARVAAVLDRLPTWDYVSLNGGRVLKGDILTPAVGLASGGAVGRADTRQIRTHVPRDYIFGWFQDPAISWTDAQGTGHREPPVPRQPIAIALAGQGQEVDVPIEHVVEIQFGSTDQSYYDLPRPKPKEFQPGTVVRGSVTGIKEFGIFVSLHERQDGLVHISRLARRGKTLRDFAVGADVAVRITKIEPAKGKIRIDLDLA